MGILVKHNLWYTQPSRTKKGFQIDADYIALSVEEQPIKG